MKNREWSARRFVIVGLLWLCMLVGGFGGWAIMAKIAGSIIASARIEVESNRQIVQHPDGGVVAEILVREGDRVTPGQTLIRLDPSQLRSQLVIVEGQLFELMARRGRLEAEQDGAKTVRFDPYLLDGAETRAEVAELIDGQRRLFEARQQSIQREVEQLEKRRGQIRSQIAGIHAQKKALRRQLMLIERELQSQISLLDRGLAQAATVLGLQRAAASLDGTLGELIAAEAQAEGRITEIDVEILKLGTHQREDAITRLRDLRYNELELAEQRRSLQERLSRLEITAPVSGVVHGLQVVAPRSVLRAADPVLYLVPQDRPLVIRARVDPIHIDGIFPGQPVGLRFTALDQRNTPELVGTVAQISADVFDDDTRGQPFYRVEIRLGDDQRARLPNGVALLPGMPVEAYIRTGDRSPLAYLVKPLADYFTRAFRES